MCFCRLLKGYIAFVHRLFRPSVDSCGVNVLWGLNNLALVTEIVIKYDVETSSRSTFSNLWQLYRGREWGILDLLKEE